MKTALIVLVFYVSSIASAQWGPWKAQVTNVRPELRAGFVAFGVVDSNVAWSSVASWSQDYNGFIRTTNGGSTWISDTMRGAPSTWNIGCISALDANRAWVCMWDNYGATSGGIAMTTNQGLTWTRDTTTFQGTGGWADIIHLFDASNGVCIGDPRGGYFEIYTTTNGGTTWSAVPHANIPSAGPGEAGSNDIFAAYGNSLWFPSTGGKYYRTTDRGMTWTSYTFPVTRPPSLAFESELVGLASAYPNQTIWKTTDGGVTWTTVPSSPPLTYGRIWSVPGSPGMDLGVYADSSYVGIAYTLDRGATWTRTGRFMPTRYYDGNFSSRSAGWLSIDSVLYKWSIQPGRAIGAWPTSMSFISPIAGSSDTVRVDIANYGQDQLSLTSIVPPGPNYKIASQPSLPIILSSLQSMNVSLAFTPQGYGGLLDSAVLVSNAANAPALSLALRGRVLSQAQSGLMYAAGTSLYSLDPGTGAPTTIGSAGGSAASGMAIHPTTSALYYTTALGASSTSVAQFDCQIGANMVVRKFPVPFMPAIAFDRKGTLYGASRTGRLYRLNLSTGDTMGIGTAPGMLYASLAFSPSGKLWASVNPPSTGKDNIYLVDTTNGNPTLVGSTGDGASTASIFFNATGTLYGFKAGTQSLITIDTLTGAGKPLFTMTLTGITSVTMKSSPTSDIRHDQERPVVFSLSQNYPNPFNPSTTIGYALPQRSQVTLIVFNTLGQRISTLANGNEEAGFHEVKFDGSRLPSGVYFYRLTAGTFVETKRLLIVR